VVRNPFLATGIYSGSLFFFLVFWHYGSETVLYLLDGVKPTPSAGEIADMVRDRVPGARIDFKPDEELQRIVDSLRPLDDGNARREWGWRPEYDLERMVDDFLKELKQNPQRYQ
jgi:nucleoside-diphosphate-sugar epimerase